MHAEVSARSPIRTTRPATSSVLLCFRHASSASRQAPGGTVTPAASPQRCSSSSTSSSAVRQRPRFPQALSDVSSASVPVAHAVHPRAPVWNVRRFSVKVRRTRLLTQTAKTNMSCVVASASSGRREKQGVYFLLFMRCLHAPVRTCVEPGSAVRERVELKFFYGLKGQRKENARSGTAASHKEIMLHMLPGTASVYKMRLRADPHRSQYLEHLECGQ